MTPKQRKLLNYVSTRIARDGYAPSLAECARHMRTKSTSNIGRMLNSLEQSGYVVRDRNRVRGLKICPDISLVGAAQEPVKHPVKHPVNLEPRLS